MRRRVSILSSLIFGLALLGCGEDAPVSTDGVGDRVFEPMGRDMGEREQIFGPDGVPLESEERVAGLVLPRGLTEIEPLREERRRVYTSQISPQQLLRYFGPRLTTVHIEHRGQRVTYREAVPRGVRGGQVRLDVSVRPTPAEPSRVEIVELPPPLPEGTVISEEEIRRHLEGLTKNRE